MIKRRCCCGGTEPGGIDCPACPSAVSPCTTPEYSVSIAVGDIYPDSAGTGCLSVSTHVLDCMRGDCGRVRYRRRALALSTLSLGVCDPADLCDSIKDEAAPPDAGDNTIRWQACVCNSFEPDDTDPCVVFYDREGAVQITWIAAQVYWNPATCFWSATAPPGTAGDCRSYIEVVYSYYDSFSYPSWEDVGGVCTNIGSTYSVNRQWTCYYSRRVAAGEFMAVGPYRLVRCDYPTAVNTIGPTGPASPGCGLAGGTVCSANGLDSIGKIPTLWQPPNTITVVREC